MEKEIPRNTIGVVHEYNFELDRCRELSRAIYQYFAAGLRPKQEWCEELARRYPLAITAEQHDKYWQFGCAKISKQMIKDCLKLIDTNYTDGNRRVEKVTIGAADFDFDTLKKLVDADNNKG